MRNLKCYPNEHFGRIKSSHMPPACSASWASFASWVGCIQLAAGSKKSHPNPPIQNPPSLPPLEKGGSSEDRAGDKLRTEVKSFPFLKEDLGGFCRSAPIAETFRTAEYRTGNIEYRSDPFMILRFLALLFNILMILKGARGDFTA